MRIWTIGFTRAALELAARLGEGFAQGGDSAEAWAPARLAEATGACAYVDLASWAARAWREADALLFVSACGIAVRAIAPQVHDKLTDPAVVCVDEAGRFAVPLLSGHVGGANGLARRVATLCGGEAVVTTATDVNGVFAVDEWAVRNGLALVGREAARAVSATLLEGGAVGLASDVPLCGTLPEGVVTGSAVEGAEVGIAIGLDATRQPFATTVHLVPRTVSVGVGCRRGVPRGRIAELVDACLREARVAPEAVCALATIDRKADEEGIVSLADARGWELRLFGADELAAVPGEFPSSEFVRETVGVGNVCERAACACGGALLLGRRSGDGVTVALGYREPTLSFDGPAEGGSR